MIPIRRDPSTGSSEPLLECFVWLELETYQDATGLPISLDLAIAVGTRAACARPVVVCICWRSCRVQQI